MIVSDEYLLRVFREKVCLVCGKEFLTKPSRITTAKYCSNECRYISNNKQVVIKCHYCGKEVSRPPSYLKWQIIRKVKHYFCSAHCSGKFLPKGENHPSWKGGVSRSYKYGYHSLEYKKWRTSVFDRDDSTCQICHKKGGYLHAHHIKSFSHFPSLRFKVSNGVTLCKDCHGEVHSRKCNQKNTLRKNLQREAMDDLKRKKNASVMHTC